MDRPVTAFRVIPYFACSAIALPPLDTLIDISTDRLRELEATTLDDVEEVFAADEE